ncbi:MAG: cytochrome c maturation protein CcmE [Dehalococcoidales bacterium]|nr:cytochrome c maturation protein CcmE [Dehalococcoidales bacterium]
MLKKKKRFLIAGLILLLPLVYLGYTGFIGASTTNYTVSELAEQGSSIYGDTVRVNGLVVAGSVEQEAQGRILRFSIVDAGGQGSLPVLYQGVVPDTFKVGNEVVVEGQLNADGVFQAGTLMAKCPSKYKPA